MPPEKPSQTLDDKLKTDERVRGNHAWNTCGYEMSDSDVKGAGVRGLVLSAEKVRELVEKKHKKNYWKIGAMIGGGIGAVAASLLMFVYTDESINKREGWFEIEKPIAEVEKYKGNIVNGLTLREVKEKIQFELGLFCEWGYVGNGDGVFCDTGITPSLNNLLDVVGIVDKEKPNSSSVVLTFDERVIKYDESIQDEVIVVRGKTNYTLTDFSQHVLDNEHNFLGWIEREYKVKIDYDKLKDLALVMAFPSLIQQNTYDSFAFIDNNTLPTIIFRLIYNDSSKKDIVLDKKFRSCPTTEEIENYCGIRRAYSFNREGCGEDYYWRSLTEFEEMACRLQKRITRDLNKHGDTGYELELVRWTTEKRDHVFTGKKTLTEQERIDAIHGLVDLLRTYIYNDILNPHDDIKMCDIKASTKNPDIISMLYSIAHSYLDGVDNNEENKEIVSDIISHVKRVLPYLTTDELVRSHLKLFSSFKTKREIKLLHEGHVFFERSRTRKEIKYILDFLEKIVMCTQEYETEIEKRAELGKLYQLLEPYTNTDFLNEGLDEAYEKFCIHHSGSAR